MDILFTELYINILEQLPFPDKLSFSIVCKKICNLPYTFYLNRKQIILLEHNKYIGQRIFKSNNFKLTTKKNFDETFDVCSHYLYREFHDKKVKKISLNEEYENYSPLRINEYSGETNQKSMQKYYLEGIPDFFTYFNYNNIQYLFLENVFLKIIPKNIVTLIMINCDNSEQVIFEKLEEYINLKLISIKYSNHITISPKNISNLNTLHIENVYSLYISNITINNMSIKDNYNRSIIISEETTNINKLILYDYDDILNSLYKIAKNVIIKDTIYTSSIEDNIELLKKKIPNLILENLHIDITKIDDFSKIQNLINLFDTVTIKLNGKWSDEILLNLSNLSFNKLIITYGGAYAILNIDKVKANMLIINLFEDDYELNITNSEIITTKIRKFY